MQNTHAIQHDEPHNILAGHFSRKISSLRLQSAITITAASWIWKAFQSEDTSAI
jgi:hypothetical protein